MYMKTTGYKVTVCKAAQAPGMLIYKIISSHWGLASLFIEAGDVAEVVPDR